MELNISAFINRVENYCRGIFAASVEPGLIYHNIRHTELVVKRVQEIAANSQLTETELFVLITAAWFHDTGHLKHKEKNHEMKSVAIMCEFFAAVDIPGNLLNQISGCILATQLPARPKTLLEMILCDADLYHLGTEEFFITNELVKKEIEKRCNTTVKNWNESSLRFLKSHKYFTSYCRQKLEPGKQNNIEKLEQIINRK